MLTEIANRYALDKGTIIPNDGRHHGPRLNFTPIYEQYLESVRNDIKSIVEIGVENGNSLKMWSEYFPNAKIYGIDINDKSQFNTDRIKCFKADQSNKEQLLDVFKEIGNVDMIVDDGSHVIKHQLLTFGALFKHLNSNGFYWIEDLHTSDGSVWQGKTLYGYDMSFEEGTSTVDIIENFIDNDEFDSKHCSPKEIDYINTNFDFVKLFDLPPTLYGFNKLALIKKK